MSNENKFLEDLKKLRTLHVNERRRLADQASAAGGGWAPGLTKQQQVIEEIDRAIADEERFGQKP